MAPGLRERKRTALERSLADTAYALVAERGFAAVTVDDIVGVAGVSRRTFSNYYSCKEEAVAAVVRHRAEDGLATWRDAPAGGNPLRLVRSLVAHQFEAGTFGTMAEVVRLAGDHPQLVPYVREAHWRLWALAGSRVLEELGAEDPARQLELSAILGAVFGVVSVGLIPQAPAAADLSSVRSRVGQVLDRLETGFGP